MTAPLQTDISGNPLPSDQAQNSSAGRVLAVPPTREFPSEQAVEFVWSGFAQLAAAGGAFVTLTDPQTGNDFQQLLQANYRARVDSLLLYCPDMVAAAAPYLFASVRNKGQLANAWGFVPIYPRSGVASLSFDTVIDLAPSSNVQLFAKNTDAANAHFLAVYLHGWYWPKDLVEG